jgi:hypothetical protein
MRIWSRVASTSSGISTTNGWIGCGATFSAFIGGAGCDFAQYGTTVYIGGTTIKSIQTSSIKGGGTPTALTAAPIAHHLAVVNQFLVGGNQSNIGTAGSAHMLQWSSIANPDDWPTPNSATAIARQSGAQSLNALYGIITDISPGDEFGVVFQRNAVHRMTYVGGSVVFQFDRISDHIGCQFPHATAQVNGITYFMGRKGFYATDGYSVRSISDGKITKYFIDRSPYVGPGVNGEAGYASKRVRCATDLKNNIIYWLAPYGTPGSPVSTGALTANAVFAYNFVEDRWGFASLNSTFLLSSPLTDYVYAFNGSSMGALEGAPGTAILTTGETEINPGSHTRIDGVKPIVDATVNAVTVQVGVRDALGDSASYGAATTANARTGFADFRTEARYHRLRLTISGTFNAAQGVEVRAVKTGDQ